MIDDAMDRRLAQRSDLIDALAEGVVVQAADGRVVAANAAAGPILGLTRDELLGRTSRDPRWYAVHEDGRRWPGEDHPAMVALRTGVAQRDQIIGIMAPDRGRRWICIHAVPLFDAGSERPTGVVSSFAEVTPHIELRNRLSAAARELNDLYDNAPCGYHTLDEQGLYTRINDTELQWLGLSRDEVVGQRGLQDFLGEEDQKAFQTQWTQRRAGEGLGDLEVELIGAQGQRRFVRLSSRLALDTAGHVLSTRSVLHDITEERARAFALAKLNADQARALDNDLISIVRLRDRRIVWTNRAFDRIFGYAQGELLGRSTECLFPSRDAFLAFGEEVYPKLRAGTSFRAQMALMRKDGAAVWADCSGFLVEPETAEVMWFALDLTEAHEAEQMRLKAVALEAENLRLRETSRLHRMFLTNISHELRSPLNAIIGFSDLLRLKHGQMDAEAVQRYGDAIGESGRNLLGMIDTLLEMANSEAGRLVLSPARVELARVVEEAVGMLRHRALSREVTVEVDVATAMPMLWVDPQRLQQVLVQLIDNAIKFSHRGGRVQVRAQATGDDRYRIEVEDHGIGIGAEDLGGLFRSFHQISAGTTKLYPGLGLGLALVKWLVDAQGGSVEVRSVLGAGSTFAVTMPRGSDVAQPGRGRRAD